MSKNQEISTINKKKCINKTYMLILCYPNQEIFTLTFLLIVIYLFIIFWAKLGSSRIQQSDLKRKHAYTNNHKKGNS